MIADIHIGATFTTAWGKSFVGRFFFVYLWFFFGRTCFLYVFFLVKFLVHVLFMSPAENKQKNVEIKHRKT